jgi:periplasmic protein TonB
MKRKNEKVPGFDEIIFENRNKEYGAYDLRKRYNSTECFSILGGIALFAALLIGLTFTIEHEGTAKSDNVFVIAKFDPIDPDLNKIKIEEPPKPPIINNQLIYRAPEVVNDTIAGSHNLVATDVIIDNIKNKSVNDTIVVAYVQDPVISVEPEPMTFVEEMPSFPGGSEALLKLISESIKYPQEAVENGIQGKVIVRFVVSSDGSVKRAEILRGVHPVLDEEAVRVVLTLPRWRPGKQNGRAVPVWFYVPVSFKIRNI